jgi:hypothetical protein
MSACWTPVVDVLEKKATRPLSISMELLASLMPAEITDWAFSAVRNPMFKMTNANAAAVITKATSMMAVSRPVIARLDFETEFILLTPVT